MSSDSEKSIPGCVNHVLVSWAELLCEQLAPTHGGRCESRRLKIEAEVSGKGAPTTELSQSGLPVGLIRPTHTAKREHKSTPNLESAVNERYAGPSSPHTG